MRKIILSTPKPFDKDCWQLTFTMNHPQDLNVTFLGVLQQERTVLSANITEPDVLQFCLWTNARETPLSLQMQVGQFPAAVALVWRGYVLELYCNGILQDEEWPIGDCLYGHSLSAYISEEIDQLTLSSGSARELQRDHPFVNAQYWRSNSSGDKVGDCMPFFDGQKFHLYYLRDRHCHQSKWALGAHQFAHISSENLEHWVEHPLAVPITHQCEGSICTGSILCAHGRYHAFYAVRMSDGSAAKISCATSDDGIHFVKSERYFTLVEPYEATSVRDPEVFADEVGHYHMLLTTSLLQGVSAARLGCLAHLTSDDLVNWIQQPPFLVPGYTDQPECANYFYWKGWYYLLFGNYGCTRYRMSRQPFGPWQKPAVEMLDCGLYRVPKTAAYFDNRRLATGFLSDDSNSGSYAGDVVFRELVQLPDGELGTSFVPELLPPTSSFCGKWHLDANPVYRYQACLLQQQHDDFNLTLELSGFSITTTFGLVLYNEAGTVYTLRFQPSNGSVTVASVEDHPCQNHWQRTMTGLCFGEAIRLRLVLQGNLLDCCVNDFRTLICRLDHWSDMCQHSLEAFVHDGQLQVNTIS